jgi:hypothetical protein
MFKPEVEDVGINIGFGQPHAQQNPGGERPDDIDPAFGIPVMLPGAAPGQPCPRGAYPSVRGMSWAKPLSSISTMGRASRSRAHKHQSFPETPAARPSLLSGASGLFICHARFAKRLPYGLRYHIKPRSAIVLAGVGMVYHLLRKLLRVDLSDLPTLAGPGSNPPGPTLDRSNANRKPLRGFSKAQAFLLS